MNRLRAFTIMELIVVIVILSVMAFIAVPNFLESSGKTRGSQTLVDLRWLGVALDSYHADHGAFPAMTMKPEVTVDFRQYDDPPPRVGRTFRARGRTQLATLTTPVAYLEALPRDLFASTNHLGYRYYTDGHGFLVATYGPDRDEATGGDLLMDLGDLAVDDGGTSAPLWTQGVEHLYSGKDAKPSALLQGGIGPRGAFSYNPTNGTVSGGDIWWARK